MTPLVRALAGAALAAALLVALGLGLTRNSRLLPSVTVGRRAPAFELESLTGKRVALADYRGRPLLVNFWASWCTECKKEHPLIMEAHDRWGTKVAFLGIIFQDSAANARGFLVDRGDTLDGSYPNLLDRGSRVAIDYGVYGVPETFFIDRRGTIVFKRVGAVTPALLTQQLDRLAR